jgi:quercetin dioxygenase-like cupin family protein
MPILRNADTVSFQIPGLEVRGLASPRRGSRETAVWQLTMAPGTPGFPHAVTREEIFVATAGSAHVTLDGQTHELAAGDTLIVPPGTQFALANPSGEPFQATVAFPVGGQAVTPDGTFTPPWAE